MKRRTVPAVNGITRGEQAARWLAKQPDEVGYNEAACRFGVSRRAVKTHWQRLGYEPRAFQGEIAARWLATQEGEVGYKEAAQRFGLQLETVRQAWRRLGFGETPRDKSKRRVLDIAESAARWLVEQEGNARYEDASARFEISTHLIRAAWERLQLGATPCEKMSVALREKVLELARTGNTRSQIKTLLGVNRNTISRWCKAGGVVMKSEIGKNGLPPPDLDATAIGLEVIRAGGSIAEGARDADVAYTTLWRYAKIAKIKPTAPNAQDPQRQLQRRGRSAQAALLVEQEGLSISEAAKIVGVAPRNVRVYLQRHAGPTKD